MKKVLPASLVIIAGAAITGGLLLRGCSPTYSRQDFAEAVATSHRDTLGAIYYKGRKDGHDYFRSRHNIGGSNFRLPVSESPIRTPFDFTSEKERWRLMDTTNLADPGLALPQTLNAG